MSSSVTLRPFHSPATSVKFSLADTHESEMATPRSLLCSRMNDSSRSRRLDTLGSVSYQPPSHHAAVSAAAAACSTTLK